jgi:hypothetical protein
VWEVMKDIGKCERPGGNASWKPYASERVKGNN